MCVSGGEEIEEAMEVERWGEEEEIAMDIDVSQEDIAEMKLVHSSFSSPSQLHIESFGIPSDYTNDYSVSSLYLSPTHSHQCLKFTGQAVPGSRHKCLALSSQLSRGTQRLCYQRCCNLLLCAVRV